MVDFKLITVLWVLAVPVVFAGCSGESEPRTLTIVFSNDLNGEIRSCGCVAKDYGGLGRRATFLNSVRDTTGDMLLLEGGDFFSSKLNYGLEKADLTMRSLSLMGYHGMVIGEADFGFGVDFIVERVRRLGLPMLVANLRDAATDSLLFDPARIVTLPSGLTVGIVGAIGARIKLPPQVKPGSVKISHPLGVVQAHVAAMRDSVDVMVVLAHMDRGEVQRIVTEVEGIDLIVYGHKGRALRNVRRIGGAFPLQVSDRGRYMGVAFAVLGDERPIRRLTVDTVPLTGYYDDDEAISKLFRSYDLSIVAKEKSSIPTGVFEARKGIEKPFVGAESCKECHEGVYDQWAGTKHAYAFEILVEKSREFDRDCTPCHTTGFYKAGGFENVTVTPELLGIQCEACHGNGNDHANDPDIATKGDSRSHCRSCHNEEQSPDFEFESYWGRIEHGSGTAGEG